MLEIELKFRLANTSAFRERLAAIGAVAGDAVEQSDAYYNHPSRDFARTDEALRVRTVGDQTWITYKGAKQGAAAKTRFELELPLADGTAEGWAEVLTRLGFRAVAVVRKQRAPFRLERRARSFALAIDEVEAVGRFVEVETVAPTDQREAAERAVVELASELGLEDPNPQSYLEMLLATQAKPMAEAD